jgi:2-dehydro-3-deoxy-D-arabinonate dehydratase
MHIYLTKAGLVARLDDGCHKVPGLDVDALLRTLDPEAPAALVRMACAGTPIVPAPTQVLAPIGTQEIWAAGVTYYRSRTARVAESAGSGGGSLYDRVYEAARPELFFKATPARTASPGSRMNLRRDSRWMVPEPELTLVLNAAGQIVGYTIGNDLSSRDIEGENALYLPQAKVWDRSAAIGPALLIGATPLSPETEVVLEIHRAGAQAFQGRTRIREMKRKPAELAAFLFREASFPTGCFLMTGTGIVPPDDFSLAAGDEIRITIEPIGTLVNTVDYAARA